MSVQNRIPSLAVVLNLSNLDLWPSYWEVLKQLPSTTSFFVSTTIDKKDAVQQMVKKDIGNAQFYAFENRGRDFGALVSLLKLVPLHQFDLVLKLHTGNSDFYSDIPNGQWLLELLGNLLPSGRLHHLLNYFIKNSSVGIAGPSVNRWPVKKLFYHENTAFHWNNLTASRKQKDFSTELFFIAGGMFWARGCVFKGLADMNLPQSQFEINSDELDGTLAHTLERYVAVLAHDQGLAVAAFDFNDFSRWLSQRQISDVHKKHFESFIGSSKNLPEIQIVVQSPSKNATSELTLTLQSIESAKQCGIQVNTQVWDESNLVPFSRHLNTLIKTSSSDWLLIIQAGDELTPCGLLMAYVEMIKQPDKLAVYTDKMLRSPSGSIETELLPDFNNDLLISFPWLMSNHWFFKRALLLELNGFDESTGQFFELAFILKLLAAKSHSIIYHLAEPLLITAEPEDWLEEPNEQTLIQKYIVDSGYPNAQVIQLKPRLYRALYLHAELPLVSIIIPNLGIQLTQRCLESLLQNTGYNHYEILIVDNLSTDAESVSWLEGIGQIDPERFRIVPNDGLQNIYAMNNAGADAASGDYLIFANPTVQFIETSWLDTFVNHAQRPKVGAVGVKLVDNSLNVYSAGFVLGMRSGNESTFVGNRYDDMGYLQRLSVDQCYSAMSSQCLMVRKSHFATVGGFNASLNSNTEADIDFCLKLKSQGLDNIWTPHAVVQWGPESTTTNNPSSVGCFPSDAFLSAWLPAIASDPAYNKNLSLIDKPFTVESFHELSWRPLSWRPLPVIFGHPSDETGCGHYRVIQPLTAMMQAGIADTVISFRPLIPSELERIQPDTIIFQRSLAREFLDNMKHSKSYSRAFKVYEIDDLITNIPLKSYFKSKHPKDAAKLLREGVSHVDRLVVSTPGLAEAYSSWHKDIQVLELKLPPVWWSNLKVMRTEHKKPRVGWAGGGSHLGDLELIADVVKDLADEVDWVFFGMCPSKLRPYVKEFHNGVPIHLYPQKLASLDLDLALAPLESNPFNECKSNLRLLEYGACAYPVICSDTRAFVESKLPVHVVKNRFKEWTSAIRSHIYDLDACHANGRELALQVNANWMLDITALNHWKGIWTPS